MTSMATLEDIVAQLGVTMVETRKELVESHKKLAESQRETERQMLRLEKNLGGLGNSIGEIVEMIVIPGVKEKMNGFGHTFTMASPGKEYYDVDGSKLTEVDLLLENCEEVMVVEVKTQASKKWVDRHLKRLEILRKKERITGMTGKTMYAAVAGIGFDEEARELAANNGMYLIDIHEDSERIDVTPPNEAKTW